MMGRLAGADTASLPGPWTLAKPARQATLRLALDPTTDADLGMAEAAMDLAEVLEEFEWAHPTVPSQAVTVDLGMPPHGSDAGRDAVATLLVGALEIAAAVLRSPAGEPSTADVLMLARVAHLISSVHLRVVGRLP